MERGNIVKIYAPKQFNGKEWLHTCFDAKVMGVIDGFAMLRRQPTGMPFIESVKQLEKWQTKPPKVIEE